MKRWFVAGLTANLLALSSSALALDGISVEAGRGSRDVNILRLAAQWNQHPAWLANKPWQLYWDASVAGWHSDLHTVYDFGLTPVFRYAPSAHGWYGEAGIGFHYLSDVHVASDLDFSTRFQFGDHVGVGYRTGSWDIGVKLQHLSNAGIRNPNPGINFLELRLGYALR